MDAPLAQNAISKIAFLNLNVLSLTVLHFNIALGNFTTIYYVCINLFGLIHVIQVI